MAKESNKSLLAEIVVFLRENSNILQSEWVEQMTGQRLIEELTPDEVKNESIVIYNTCVECLESGRFDSAVNYASKMATRAVLQGMTAEQIIAGMLVLRDTYSRSLINKYQSNMSKLSSVLDLYEPVANKILTTVALAFVEEVEKLVRKQQLAILELSTPVLILRDNLLLMPIIGVIDSARAKQLTEHLLNSIRTFRGKAVVMDITGVGDVDSKVANHLIQTIEAARLLGSAVFVSGISPAIAQTLVTIGVDLSKLKTVTDLQSGIDEADKFLGYKLNKPVLS